MEYALKIFYALAPILVAVVVGLAFLKIWQWLNRGQVRKWEQAVEDSSSSVKLQQEILAEMKAIRTLLEKR